jgi:hypothetical protein
MIIFFKQDKEKYQKAKMKEGKEGGRWEAEQVSR